MHSCNVIGLRASTGSGSLASPVVTQVSVPFSSQNPAEANIWTNYDFATNPLTSSVATLNNWSFSTDGPASTASWVVSPSELPGSAHAVSLTSSGATPTDCYFIYEMPKESLDLTNGIVMWDQSHAVTTGRSALFIRAYSDVGLTTHIENNTNGLCNLYVAGATGGTLGSAANSGTLYVASPTLNQRYTKVFDLKSFISARLTAGKTWADVAVVEIYFNTYTQAGALNASWKLNNFR